MEENNKTKLPKTITQSHRDVLLVYRDAKKNGMQMSQLKALLPEWKEGKIYGAMDSMEKNGFIQKKISTTGRSQYEFCVTPLGIKIIENIDKIPIGIITPRRNKSLKPLDDIEPIQNQEPLNLSVAADQLVNATTLLAGEIHQLRQHILQHTQKSAAFLGMKLVPIDEADGNIEQ